MSAIPGGVFVGLFLGACFAAPAFSQWWNIPIGAVVGGVLGYVLDRMPA